jgi:hypothetical protein
MRIRCENQEIEPRTQDWAEVDGICDTHSTVMRSFGKAAFCPPGTCACAPDAKTSEEKRAAKEYLERDRLYWQEVQKQSLRYRHNA